MPAIFRPAPPQTQKILSGQAFFKTGDQPLRNLGDVTFQRTVKTENVEITSNEVPEKPVLLRVTTSVNEDFKLTCMSFIPLVQALSFMAEPGEFFTQDAVAQAEISVPAGAYDGDVYECIDPATKQHCYDVTFTNKDLSKYVYDEKAGRIEVISLDANGKPVPRAAIGTVQWSANEIEADARKAVFRILSKREIRGKLVIRENNLLGANQDHVYPLVSFRMNGSQDLIDDGKQNSKVEIDGAVEFDSSQPLGRERGWVVDL